MVFAATLSRTAAPLLRARPTIIASQAPLRLLSTSVVRRGKGWPTIIQGEGAKPGETPTNLQQATGLERLEMLGRMEGVDIFDMKPLDSSRTGTLKDPIVIKSPFPQRIIGCSGSPAGSHDTIYLRLTPLIEHHRCPECGSVYVLDVIGGPKEDHH